MRVRRIAGLLVGLAFSVAARRTHRLSSTTTRWVRSRRPLRSLAATQLTCRLVAAAAHERPKRRVVRDRQAARRAVRLRDVSQPFLGAGLATVVHGRALPQPTG